mgnify:CR=1 FL=1
MFFIFWATFFLGEFPMEWIENTVDILSNIVNDILPEGPLQDLLADGTINTNDACAGKKVPINST